MYLKMMTMVMRFSKILIENKKKNNKLNKLIKYTRRRKRRRTSKSKLKVKQLLILRRFNTIPLKENPNSVTQTKSLYMNC